MIKKLIFGLSFLALASAMPVVAQVTIGSGQAPATGALLDLKTETDGTSDKGLGMPRVALSKLNPTTPAELSASIGSTGNWDLAANGKDSARKKKSLLPPTRSNLKRLLPSPTAKVIPIQFPLSALPAPG